MNQNENSERANVFGMNVEAIAKVTHQANKAYCEALGDTSQKEWESAPDWQKESARKGVIFHLDNPDASPSASHESWLKEKEAAGWKYGEVKDEAAKTHPCYVAYDELPLQQRIKDYLFKAVVHAFMDSKVGIEREATATPQTPVEA